MLLNTRIEHSHYNVKREETVNCVVGYSMDFKDLVKINVCNAVEVVACMFFFVW
jgi:hypothetical protein